MRSELTGTGDEVIDADYVVVTPEPRPSPSGPGPLERPAAAGMDMLRRSTGFARPAGAAKRGGPLFWGGGIALVVMAFWMAGGHALFRHGHALASAPSDLRITSFSSRVERGGPRPALVVDGDASNEGTDAVALPSIEIQVTSGNGTLTRYKLGTAAGLLAAGGVFPFSGRLDLPKHGVKTVSVAFVE